MALGRLTRGWVLGVQESGAPGEEMKPPGCCSASTNRPRQALWVAVRSWALMASVVRGP